MNHLVWFLLYTPFAAARQIQNAINTLHKIQLLGTLHRYGLNPSGWNFLQSPTHYITSIIIRRKHLKVTL